jgi:hypothetical protein
MDIASAEAAIRDRATSLWNGIAPSIPLTWPNDDFMPGTISGTPQPFVRMEIVWNGSDGITIGAPGGNVSRRTGHIWAHAFVAKGAGNTVPLTLVGEAAGMFEDEDFSGIVCEAAQPGGEASDEDGNYFGLSAAVPFYFDETI